MELGIFLAMLAAAFCHAAWNAAIKLRLDPAIAVTVIAVAAGLPAVPIVAVMGAPAVESWPYLAASTAIHLGYHLALAQAYRSGDLGQVYPIARGTAPLITAAVSALVFREPMSVLAWGGVLMLTGGILLLALRGGRGLAGLDRRAAGFALATAAIIASYTLVDGRGARASGNALAYTAWFFVLDAMMMAAYGFARQRHALLPALRDGWTIAIGGGALSLISYAIALWAMTKAPIALVAAMRETSVLFAAAIGVVLLKEPVKPVRIVAAVLVMAGLVLIRLQ